MTAVAAAREGLTVALLEPGRHLGGMVSGGLGWTDYGKKEVIGGYSLEFFERVGAKYGRDDRVALRAARRRGGVQRSGQGGRRARVPSSTGFARRTASGRPAPRVTAIVTENGSPFQRDGVRRRQLRRRPDGAGRVSYTWGREAISAYGESLAGVRDQTPLHSSAPPSRRYDAAGRLLPEIMPRTDGSGRRRGQARPGLQLPPVHDQDRGQPRRRGRSRAATIRRALRAAGALLPASKRRSAGRWRSTT